MILHGNNGEEKSGCERLFLQKLEIAMQDIKITAEQQSRIEMVKEYAKEKGIEVTITVVK